MMTLAGKTEGIALLAMTLGTLAGCGSDSLGTGGGASTTSTTITTTSPSTSTTTTPGTGGKGTGGMGTGGMGTGGTGTGGTGTGGMGTGGGGTGGMAGTCTKATDCAGTDTDCEARTCTSGHCGVAFTADGTPTQMQVSGTCQKKVCDGVGGVKSIEDDTNLPVDGKQCTGDVCTGGVPSNPPVPPGTPCTQSGGIVCDGAGACVACTKASDCPSGVCTQNACAAASCTDGVKNGAETDVDCGGGTCPTCANGKKCGGNGDCTSNLCSGGVCTAQVTCTDGVQDGMETGVDCGGPVCPACVTVLVIGAGAGSGVGDTTSFGAELHPTAGSNGTWSAPVSLTAPSVSDLGLTFVGSGASAQAVGVARFTRINDALDQQVVAATWTTAGSWVPFAAIGSATPSREVPAVAGAGSTAFAVYQGTDFKHYFASYTGGVWSPLAEPVGAVQSSGPTPPGIAAIGGNATLAFFDGNNNPTAQDRTGGTWMSTVGLGTDQSYVATPSIVAMNGGTAELLTAYIRQSDGALLFNTRTGGVWSATAPVPGASAPASSTFGPVERVALAALPGGGAILAWRDKATTGLFYALYGGGAWSAAPIPFSTPNVTLSVAPALAHGVAGATAEIAFVESDSVAYHARLVGGAWTVPVAVGGVTLSHVTIAASP